jgi:hypothetical protein
MSPAKRRMQPLILIWVCTVSLLLALLPASASAEESSGSVPTTTELEFHLDLTRQFYEALGHTETSRDRSLSTDTDLSERYLEQIAISTRFMVETNLRLLKEQAEIKALLQELLKRSQK